MSKPSDFIVTGEAGTIKAGDSEVIGGIIPNRVVGRSEDGESTPCERCSRTTKTVYTVEGFPYAVLCWDCCKEAGTVAKKPAVIDEPVIDVAATLKHVIEVLEPLHEVERERVLASAATFYNVQIRLQRTL